MTSDNQEGSLYSAIKKYQKGLFLNGRLSTIFDAVHAGIIILSSEGTIIYANKAAGDIFEMEPSEIIGKNTSDPVWQLVREDGSPLSLDQSALNDMMNQFRRAKNSVYGIFSGIREKMKWLLINTEKITGSQSPETQEIIVVFNDITAMKNAQQALAQSESDKAAILGSMAEMVAYYKDTLQIKWINKSAAESLNREPADLIGLKCHTLWENSDTPCPDCPVLKAMKSGKSHSLERQSPDGRWWLLRAVPYYDDKGQMDGVVEFGQNITVQKEAETEIQKSRQHFEAVFQNAMDSILLTDSDGNYVNANPAACKLLEYSRKEFLEMTPADIASPENTADFESLWEDFLKNGIQGGEIILKSKTGKSIIAEYQAVANVLPGIHLSILRDVTKRKEAEQLIIKSEKLESIGVLAGGIAHDFNNLLTAILGNISLVRIDTHEKDDSYKRLLEAERATLRARELTQQLLTFARGGKPIKKISNLGEILTESAQFALHGSNVKCRFEIDSDLHYAEIDEGQVVQAVNNLVINAKQAMPEGGTITIVAENRSLEDIVDLNLSPGDYIKISIEDAGNGIPKRHINKIFDPFFTTKKEGSGLGLSSVYSIIKNHGGTIDVSSKSGIGTTFTIYLPACVKPAKSGIKDDSEKPVKGSGKILIMDDDNAVRMVGSTILRKLGYEVDWAEDGQSAIKLYKNASIKGLSYTAVILDLTIPGGLGGRETLNELKEYDPDITAIVSSGYSNDPVMAEYDKYGFSARIVKPYTPAQLSRTLANTLETKYSKKSL